MWLGAAIVDEVFTAYFLYVSSFEVDKLVMLSIYGGWAAQTVVACINRMRRNKSASDVVFFLRDALNSHQFGARASMSGRRAKSCSLRSNKGSNKVGTWSIVNSEEYIGAVLIEHLPVTARKHCKTLNI
jgi:hypothetical protein